MKRHAVSIWAGIAAVALGFGGLLFGPAQGHVSISPFSDAFFQQILTPQPVADARLTCYEQTLAKVPDGSSIEVRPGDDSYSEQRIIEIVYPRLAVGTSDTDYVVHFTEQELGERDGIVETAFCDPTYVTVIEQ